MGVHSTRYDDSYAVGEGGVDGVVGSRMDTRRRSQQPKAGDSDGREALLWKGQEH